MKKILIGVLFAVSVNGMIFSQANEELFSIGGGGFFASDFGGGFELRISQAGRKMTETVPMTYKGGGGFVFFDAKYAVLSFGLLEGGDTWKYTEKYGSQTLTEEIGDYSFSSINIGFMSKYPFSISPKFSLFPMLGIEYQTLLSCEIENENIEDKEDFNQFWIKFGVGADFSITQKIFFRVEALYGFRPASKGEKDTADIRKEFLEYEYPSLNILSDTKLGHGLTIKAAIGYRF